jgi:hypothetical protein
MNISKSGISHWNFRKTIGISKMLGMAFVISVALAIMSTYTENALSQTTLFTCNTSNGISSSATNCLTNSPAAKINPVAPRMNQTTTTAPLANQTTTTAPLANQTTK